MYVVEGSIVLVSRDVLETLGCIPKSFPRIGEFLEPGDKALTGLVYAVNPNPTGWSTDGTFDEELAKQTVWVRRPEEKVATKDEEKEATKDTEQKAAAPSNSGPTRGLAGEAAGLSPAPSPVSSQDGSVSHYYARSPISVGLLSIWGPHYQLVCRSKFPKRARLRRSALLA